MMPSPTPVFISYAHKDEQFLKELRTHLKPLERSNEIKVWTDEAIVAGEQWDDLIRRQLRNADIVIMLVSPDFIASDYIHDVELKDIIARGMDDLPVKFSVVVRPTILEDLEFNALQVVPTGAKAVSEWESRDRAWNDVRAHLERILEQITKTEGTTEQITDKKRETDALIAYDKVPLHSKVASSLSIALVVGCIALLVASFFMDEGHFYSLVSLAGIVIGFLGYWMVMKSRS